MEWNEVVNLLPALLAGIGLGVLFFGGLWLTVKNGLGSDKARLIFALSFIVRLAIVLAGFYFVGAGNWKKMVVCLVGFLFARIVITRLTKKSTSKSISVKMKQ